MKTFPMILVLAAMAVEGRKKQPLENYNVFEGKGLGGGKFFVFDPTTVNEEVCTGLCSEMPICKAVVFRTEAETWSEALQCRFKKSLGMGKTNQPTRNSYVKNEDGSYEKFVGTGINKRDLFNFAPSDVNEEICAKLCNYIPRCVGFTFRVAAEVNTEESQCRLKENVTEANLFDQANRRSFLKIEP